MAIVLDGKVISSATIQDVIRTKGEITNPLHWKKPKGKKEAATVTSL